MKTRRNRNNKKRKTRQRGGKQVFLSVKKLSGYNKEEKPAYTVNKATFNVNGKTPRNLFHNYIRQNSSLMTTDLPLLYKGNPRFVLRRTRNSKPIVFRPEQWNNESLLNNQGDYFFQYIPETQEEKDIKEAGWLETLKIVLEYYKDSGAKVIPFSSAATDDIPKNVRQQFKFDRDPKNPIVLIDPAFFETDRSDFFQYIAFSKPEDLPGTYGKAKIYRKPAGVPFQIVGQKPGAPPIEEQRAYLRELHRQRGTFFNELDELEICCVKAGVPDERIFDELLASYRGRFKQYSFGA